MSKTSLTSVFVIIFSLVVNGQTSTDTILKLTFQPAFHNPSYLTIYREQDSIKGSFQSPFGLVGKAIYSSTIVMIPNGTYDSIVRFFNKYHFPGYIDNRMPDTTRNYVRGMDGITISGVYYGTINRLFRFWSPYHDKESMKLFKMTLDLLDDYFRNRNNKKYIKTLRVYAK